MKFESPQPRIPSGNLAERFKNLVDNPDHQVFESLEEVLKESGFSLADETHVSEVINNNTLITRSENFTRVMDMLTTGEPLHILNKRDEANMCVMASGEGLRTAMEEGFSGKDVGGAVKVVMTFGGSGLTERKLIPKDRAIWNTKTKSAQISLIGAGEVTLDDVVMLSFRFPINSLESISFPSNKVQFLTTDIITHLWVICQYNLSTQ